MSDHSRKVAECAARLSPRRLFRPTRLLFLLSLSGIAIYFALDLLSRLVLRNWHESALEEEE